MGYAITSSLIKKGLTCQNEACECHWSSLRADPKKFRKKKPRKPLKRSYIKRKKTVKKKKAVKKPTRKKLVKTLDDLCSLYIRARDNEKYGHCVFCFEPIEHCFHFVNRGHYITRWDLDNMVGSCAGCNLQMNFRPERFWQWLRNEKGHNFVDALIAKSKQFSHFSNADLTEMIKTMREWK